MLAIALVASIAPSLTGLRFIENPQIKLGIDLDKGGSIVYLAKRNGPNIINSADLGRQIQMSFYSGPVPFAPNGKQPAKAWAGLGWNPIQTGDYYNHPSKTLDFKSDGRSLFVRCIPMQWPLNNEPGECIFEASIELVKNAVQVHSRLVNHRFDLTQYPARAQELPAIYTNAPWYRLVSYTGDKPFTNGKLSTLSNSPPASTFPWVTFGATENWTALVDSKDWGIGIIEPGCQTMSGGFFGKPGTGGEKDSETGYIAPNYVEILDSNIDYRFDYALVVGALNSIRDYAYSLIPRPKPPSYKFENSRLHWFYRNAKDTGWPIRGELNVTLEDADPQLIGPSGLWQASDAPKLIIAAAFHCQSPHAQVFWSTFGKGFSEAQSVWFKTVPDGKMRTYTVDLSSAPEYRGAITGLRIDPEPNGNPGDAVRVRSIELR